jgi:transcription elongation factor Elf1
MIEYACKDLVFHFNKKHLEDESIPMWVIKTHGETFYVNHVSASLPWSTKETPNNSHTKGSIKFKRCLLRIDNDNNAEVSELTEEDECRLSGEFERCRVITRHRPLLTKALRQLNITHSKIVQIGGYCSTAFYVCDIVGKKHLTMLGMMINDLRVLQPNEDYSRWYDDAIAKDQEYHYAEDEENESLGEEDYED